MFFHPYLPSDSNGDGIPARKADGCPHDETPEQLAELKKSFQTPRNAADYVMDTFMLVKRKNEAKWSHYTTKETFLQIYDEMQRAFRSGGECKTRLDPPPGDRCCYPARAEKARTKRRWAQAA